MSKAEYKRLGDYIREMNVRNREQRAMQAYTFGDGSEMVRRRMCMTSEYFCKR